MDIDTSPMLLEYIRKGKAKAAATVHQALLKALADCAGGSVPEDVRQRIEAQEDLTTLTEWCLGAARCTTWDKARELIGASPSTRADRSVVVAPWPGRPPSPSASHSGASLTEPGPKRMLPTGLQLRWPPRRGAAWPRRKWRCVRALRAPFRASSLALVYPSPLSCRKLRILGPADRDTRENDIDEHPSSPAS